MRLHALFAILIVSLSAPASAVEYIIKGQLKIDQKDGADAYARLVQWGWTDISDYEVKLRFPDGDNCGYSHCGSGLGSELYINGSLVDVGASVRGHYSLSNLGLVGSVEYQPPERLLYQYFGFSIHFWHEWNYGKTYLFDKGFLQKNVRLASFWTSVRLRNQPASANFVRASGTVDSIEVVGTPVSFSAPVPEPSTWAVMISGLGLIGVALRRRRLIAGRARSGTTVQNPGLPGTR